MHPLLFEIPVFGGIRIYSYGVLVALGFLMGIWWTTREAKLAKVDAEKILDLSYYIVLAGLVGSRILYIIVDWKRYAANPLDALRLWEGGLVFYGGFLGALAVTVWFIKKHRLSFMAIADIFSPGLALGHAIGRLGCFAAGCCYGRATDSHFHLIFPQTPYALAPAGIPLIPSQLMEAVTELVIFMILIFLRRGKRFEGQIFLVYLVLYSVSRSVLETFRGDSLRGFVVPGLVSTSQMISFFLVVFAAVMYVRLQKGRVKS